MATTIDNSSQAVEVFYPPFAGQSFVSNYPDEEDRGASSVGRSDMAMEAETPDDEDYEAEEQPGDDDFANKLRQRP